MSPAEEVKEVERGAVEVQEEEEAAKEKNVTGTEQEVEAVAISTGHVTLKVTSVDTSMVFS